MQVSDGIGYFVRKAVRRDGAGGQHPEGGEPRALPRCGPLIGRGRGDIKCSDHVGEALAARDPAVRVDHDLDHPSFVELRTGSGGRRCRPCPCARRGRRRAPAPPRPARPGVTHRHEQSRHPVVDDLAAAPHVGRDHRQAGLAAASMAARGKPSRRDGRTNMSMPPYSRSTSSRMPRNRTPWSAALRMTSRVERVGLLRVVGPDRSPPRSRRRAAARRRTARGSPFSATWRPTIPTTIWSSSGVEFDGPQLGRSSADGRRGESARGRRRCPAAGCAGGR